MVKFSYEVPPDFGLHPKTLFSRKSGPQGLELNTNLSTPWKTNMDPENHWLVEENTLPGGHCQGLC